MSPLIQESKDNHKRIRYLRKLIKIRTKIKKENNTNSHKPHQSVSFNF